MSTKSPNRKRKLSQSEQIKADSNFLREPLATVHSIELSNENVSIP